MPDVPAEEATVQRHHETLAGLLTAARLSSYTESTESLEGALRLYEWNIRAASSVMELTGMVEVITRNALDRELRTWATRRAATGAWFEHVPLDVQGRSDLAKARSRATRNGHRGEVHGRVIAELTFGFWRYLVESRYHTSLWVPALHRAFPHGPEDLRVRRNEVRRRLQQLHFVRNRAAHHEPIHGRDLVSDAQFAVELLGWVSPSASTWGTAAASLPQVITHRP